MIAFADGLATRVPERDYANFVLAGAEDARRRLWVSQFIFDTRPPRDLAGQVLELALTLAARRQAGVDVKVLLTGSLSTPDIAVANLAAGLMLEGWGVAHRRIFEVGDPVRGGSHAKFVIRDDEAVLGSQNWTDDAFRLNIEDSVLLSGRPVTLLAAEFQRLWELGRGTPRGAAA
jgi:phosphatidylserine/phosphatidylglycerophosphate/cardiolipin synthase-like enzyme